MTVFNIVLFPDVNECELEIDSCNSNADCMDTDGSYNCTCKLGFTGNGTACDGNDIKASFSFFNIDLLLCLTIHI